MYTLGLVSSNTFSIDSFLECSLQNSLNLLRMRIIRFDPSFLDLVNTPDTNLLFSVTFAVATIFYPLSNATSLIAINSSSCESGNINLDCN